MAHEEHSQKCSNSSSGGGGGSSGGAGGSGGGGIRSSKKMKQKKVPQRGLGVAQLEKIRLEEQQKKDSIAIYTPNSIISPSSNSSCLVVQCPNPSSIPLPPLSPSDLSSSVVSVYRPPATEAHLIPNMDLLNPNSVSDLKPLNEIGLPKFWIGDYHQNLEGDRHRLDHHNHGFAFSSNLNLPCELQTLPNVMNRPEQFHQPHSSSMVNVSSGTSSSSVINYQMEPPSNQSYYGNNYTAMWPEEEKMVGMKRSYPYSLDNPPVPSFHCKFPPTYVAPITRSDESASYSNGGAVNIEHGDLIFQEGPSSSSAMAEPNSMKVIKENGRLNGDFLTLAPPTTTIPQKGSNYKHPSAYVTSHCHELPKFESIPYQGSVEEQAYWQRPSESTQQQLLYSFFAPAKTQTGQEATTISNFNGEVGESVDLDLKL